MFQVPRPELAGHRPGTSPQVCQPPTWCFRVGGAPRPAPCLAEPSERLHPRAPPSSGSSGLSTAPASGRAPKPVRRGGQAEKPPTPGAGQPPQLLSQGEPHTQTPTHTRTLAPAANLPLRRGRACREQDWLRRSPDPGPGNAALRVELGHLPGNGSRGRRRTMTALGTGPRPTQGPRPAPQQGRAGGEPEPVTPPRETAPPREPTPKLGPGAPPLGKVPRPSRPTPSSPAAEAPLPGGWWAPVPQVCRTSQ